MTLPQQNLKYKILGAKRLKTKKKTKKKTTTATTTTV